MSKTYNKSSYTNNGGSISRKNDSKKRSLKGSSLNTEYTGSKRERLMALCDELIAKSKGNTSTSSAKKRETTSNAHSTARTDKKITKDFKHSSYSSKIVDKPSMKVAFLGGMDEIGKNVTVFECLNDMMVLDCGMTFPDGDMPGVDLVLPDFTYIERHVDRIKGIVITHGHEDHIGALPYLLQKVDLPIYATPLTVSLIKAKLSEHKQLKNTKIIEVHAGQSIQLGCMTVEFIHTNHSIPDAVGVAIHSPAGTIVHTGDFKIDFTPTKDNMIDLAKFAQLGQEGVLALFADSTNAEKPGYTLSEQRVAQTFRGMFKFAKDKRIIVASFASNINRITQIIKIASENGRKVAFSGRSMINNMSIARELGYVDVDEGAIIDIDKTRQYPDENIVIITTGSQGEPMSALSRMAHDDHRHISVGANDVIIISARPIPGNEKMVGLVIDELLKRNCKVIYESMYEVHVSGHACEEELKLMHGLVKPKYFIPVHGERKHLVKHAEIAKFMGMPSKNIFIGKNGSAIELNDVYMKECPSVPTGRILVDGTGVGDVGSVVLRDRKLLSQDGLIIVVAVMNVKTQTIESGPEIFSRGFVYVKESEPLLYAAKSKADKILEDCLRAGDNDWSILKIKLRDGLSKFFYERTKRNPMILPIIMGVN